MCDITYDSHEQLIAHEIVFSWNYSWQVENSCEFAYDSHERKIQHEKYLQWLTVWLDNQIARQARENPSWEEREVLRKTKRGITVISWETNTLSVADIWDNNKRQRDASTDGAGGSGA